MNLTEQQQAILAEASSPTSLQIVAYAGCGKTSTIEAMIPHLRPASTLYVVFNKRNADEARKRLPERVEVKTLNGLGHGALQRALGRRLRVETGKIGAAVTSAAAKLGFDRLESELWTEVLQLVNAARTAGMLPSMLNLTAKTLLTDEPDNWEGLADKLFITFTQAHYNLAREALALSITQALREGVIDYDDQIYLSTLVAGNYQKYEIILVDEAQDLSPLNHLQIKKSLWPNSKLIVVGDPLQAIYAFRGAHSHSMKQMMELRESWVTLPLSLTFRCPKVVVQRQQEHAIGFEAHPSNPTGTFTQLDAWHWSDIPAGSTAILCRNNGPIIDLAFKLIRQQIGVQVLGRDIGKSLMNLVKKICGDDLGRPAAECLADITSWAEKEIHNARAKGKEEKIDAILDRKESLHAVIESGGAATLAEIITLIERIFQDKDARVVLSTGHKAKGMEWQNVIHLDPWRLPSKYAKQALELYGNPVPMEQDLNLRYVIETRAQRNLFNASLELFQQTKEAT